MSRSPKRQCGTATPPLVVFRQGGRPFGDGRGVGRGLERPTGAEFTLHFGGRHQGQFFDENEKAGGDDGGD
jgi:hypothetical protein